MPTEIFGLMQVSFKKLSILQMMMTKNRPTTEGVEGESGSDNDEEF